jgi:hypothetical protein
MRASREFLPEITTNVVSDCDKDVKKKSPRIVVPMYYYKFISKSSVMPDIDGFATTNLCECVCGFITSDQGYAFFHFSLESSAESLAEFAAKDFLGASKIQVILLGGNPSIYFFPWKSKNRDILYSASKPRDSDNGRSTNIDSNAVDLKKDEDAWQQIKSTLESNPNRNRFFLVHRKCEPSIPWGKSKYNTCIRKIKNNLLVYQMAKLNAALHPNGEKLIAAGPELQFTLHNFKDSLGYQNLARLTKALTKYSNLFNKDNIIHFNTINDAVVLADFVDGKCHVYDRENEHDLIQEVEVEIGSPLKKIDSVRTISPLESLKKQKIRSGYGL